MSLWDYLHTHPVWGLVYLVIICFTLIAVVVAHREDKKPEEASSEKKGPRPLMG